MPDSIVDRPGERRHGYTAPAAPQDDPYLCTLTYCTAGGRTRVKSFWLYVIDPVLFRVRIP